VDRLASALPLSSTNLHSATDALIQLSACRRTVTDLKERLLSVQPADSMTAAAAALEAEAAHVLEAVTAELQSAMTTATPEVTKSLDQVLEPSRSTDSSFRALSVHRFQFQSPLGPQVPVPEPSRSTDSSSRALSVHRFQFQSPLGPQILVPEPARSTDSSSRALSVHRF
jgi:hypothetical protein